MNNFRRYAAYYDLAYADKDYGAEIDFVIGCLGLNDENKKRVLELGCGTGRHAVELMGRGWHVTGIDISPEMVEIARRRVCREGDAALNGGFSVGDIRSVNLGARFDAVVSLFHVISYQEGNGDLKAAFRAAADHLKEDGRFLFDFWYGPAVLTEPPAVRVKRFQGDGFSVMRVAEPNVDMNRNIVDVNYELIFEEETGVKTVERINETHTMRYLFLPEIEELLEQAGLRIYASGKWMSDEGLGFSAWNGWVVAEHAR